MKVHEGSHTRCQKTFRFSSHRITRTYYRVTRTHFLTSPPVGNDHIFTDADIKGCSIHLVYLQQVIVTPVDVLPVSG